MKRIGRKWGGDVGSIDFVQTIVGLMIVGIACVGTFAAMQYGNDQLNYQMRYRKAMSVARSYLEYWQGRIHTDLPKNLRDWQGNLGQNVPQTLLDPGDPLTANDDLYCYVRYGQITPVYNQELGVDRNGHTVLSHYVIRVYVTWWEPDQPENTPPHEVKFEGTMVPAALP